MTRGARAQLEALLAEGLAAVDGEGAVARHVADARGGLVIGGHPLPDDAALRVAAIGKAAVPMARALERAAGDRVAGGLVITADGLADPPPARLPVRTSGHPVPDARGEAAARELLALVADAPARDVLVVLLSGGASALTSCPADGLTLADLAATTELLLACGADISETNAVRKHLSAFSGGRLAAAARAEQIVVLAISDVPGDALDVIGSGPCEADPTRFADALAIAARRGIAARLPARVRAHLEAGAAGRIAESPKPGDPRLARVHSRIVARNADARAAIVAAAARAGLRGVDLGEVLRGEAREAGRRLIALARSARASAPLLLVAGGETVVTLRGAGRGGRNQELALAAAVALAAGGVRASLLAAGSDGRDGPTDAAGAFVDEASVRRGLRAGADAKACLADNDSHGFFLAEGGLLRTGPTRTNVMDLALLRVEPASG